MPTQIQLRSAASEVFEQLLRLGVLDLPDTSTEAGEAFKDVMSDWIRVGLEDDNDERCVHGSSKYACQFCEMGVRSVVVE